MATACEKLRTRPLTKEQYVRLYRQWLDDTQPLRRLAARLISTSAPSYVIYVGRIEAAHYPPEVEMQLEEIRRQIENHGRILGLLEAPHDGPD